MASSQVLETRQGTCLIRPFQEDDIGQVAELHRSAFATGPSMSPELLVTYTDYFRQVFFRHPVQVEGLTPLVYEEAGKVMGFAGSKLQPMRLRGRPVLARIMSQFSVYPRCRGVAGVKLLQTVLRGPQDLTIADESNTFARGLWEACGGRTARLQSLVWIFPFRPCSFALSVVGGRGSANGVLAGISWPVARSIDWLAARTGLSPFQPVEPRLAGCEMDFDALLANLSGDLDQSLRPAHDRNSLEWALARAAGFQRRGKLRMVAVKSKKQQTAGWYVYYSNPGGVAEVLQISARRSAAQDVFNHLLHDAGERGANAVSGAFDPVFMESYVERRCVMRGGPWVLVHSRDPELVRAFQDGDVFFSRLEGEWCMHLR